jgi:hypothetical protein
MLMLLGAVVLWTAVPAPVALADCGSVPYYSPFTLPRLLNLETFEGGKEKVNFDPMDVVVYEPGQRGIILWNGEEEILLLSTEIRTSQLTQILEVIPFPAEPTVTLGDIETFKEMEKLLLKKTMWTVASGGGVPVNVIDNAAEITFYAQMGAHDVAVVKVLNKDYFVDWVMNYMQEQQAVNPKINPDFLKVINNYLDRGYTWFVFDTIVAQNTLQSHEPLEFRFKSKAVYYPLEISTLETGKTNIDLLLLTKAPITTYGALTFAVKRDKGVALTAKELAPVSADWAAFMKQQPMTMQRVHIRGDISKLKEDFIVK